MSNEEGAPELHEEEEEFEFQEKEDNRTVDLGDGLPPLLPGGSDRFFDFFVLFCFVFVFVLVDFV